MFCKIGDTIGYIIKSQKFGETEWKWKLVETNVDRLYICKDGVRVYTKSFRALYDDEIRSNTNIITGNSKLILVQEPFLLNDDLRERVTQWVEWMNEDPKNEMISSGFGKLSGV